METPTRNTPITIDSLGQERMKMPMMIYGTAWKGEETETLVYEALKAGFRGIDSGVGEHYNERGVGLGIAKAIKEASLQRTHLYIQTKFRVDDDRFEDTTKYPNLESKVKASVEQSLRDLSINQKFKDNTLPYIDCLLIHEGKKVRSRLQLTEIARALKPFVPKQVRSVGVSNVDDGHLQFFKESGFLPAVVQNTFSINGIDEFDGRVRYWCRHQNYPDFEPEKLQFLGPKFMIWQKGYRVAYQAFHTVTANREVWEKAPYVARLVEEIKTVEAVNIWYHLLISDGIVALNGTRRVSLMRGDMIQLKRIHQWKALHDNKLWDKCQGVFRDAIAGVARDIADDNDDKDDTL